MMNRILLQAAMALCTLTATAQGTRTPRPTTLKAPNAAVRTQTMTGPNTWVPVAKHADRTPSHDAFRGGPPANDNCPTATVLTPGVTCVPVAGECFGATQSIPSITCNTYLGTAEDDVWYQFVATASDHTILVDGSLEFDAVVDLRSGACNGTNIACADATVEDEVEQILASGLSIGTTYYIRVYEFYATLGATSTFDICVLETPGAPGNDECASVTPDALSIGGTLTFNGTTVGATYTNDAVAASDWDDAIPKVWHAFTTPACADITVEYCGTTPAFGTVTAGLADACPADVLTLYDAGNFTDCPDGNATFFFYDVPAGTWYIPVGNYGVDSNGPYTFNVSAAACATGGPVNDDCGDVTAVPVAVPGSTNFTGDNTGASNAGDASPGTIMDVGGDTTTVWHAFTITECANISVAYCGTLPLPAVYWAVLATTCPADDNLIFFSTGNFDDCVDGNATIFFDNVPAGTYYLPVRGEPATEGPYAIELITEACDPTPVNDDCANAIEVDVEAPVDCPANAVAGNNSGATQDEVNPSCDPNGALTDVWYTFNSLGNSEVSIDVVPSPSMTDWVVVVYQGCGGSEDTCFVTPGAPIIFTTTPFTDYVVRVYSNLDWGVPGPFTICVSADISTGMHTAPAIQPWSVFPNPGNGDLTVVYGGVSDDVVIDLIDITGRSVHQQRGHLVTGQQVPLRLAGRLAQGTYTLRLSSLGGSSEQRVVIE